MSDNVITELTRERSELIERLSQAHQLLARTKGLLEANQVAAATLPLTYQFSEFEKATLDRINTFLAEGLFGDKGKEK